jgi:UTP--glucose-1-phosphate uridylyltransferase
MNEPLPDDVRETLAAYHFDRVPLDVLRARLAAAADPESLHVIRDPLAPPPPDAVTALPEPASAEGRALRAQGEAALARGELAAVILAGGMATRFGARVKALCPLAEGRPTRFLDAKLADVQRHGGVEAIDTTVMTSFATDEAIGEAIEGMGVHRARQFVSLRLAPDGTLFRDKDGHVSLYATGHGDLPDALALSGTLARLRARGVRTVLMSNVDNLGATIDPALYALHRRLGGQITVELVAKKAGDKGGIPVLHQGKLVLAEAFRLPKDFPQDAFPSFNTNTLWIDLDALEGEFPWTWCVARKKVDGREAVQFERLVGELTWWKPTRYVQVPREGAQSRFLPVKEVEDLTRLRGEIAAVLRERVGLEL